MKAFRRLLLVLVLAAVGAAAYFYYYLPHQRAKTADTAAASSGGKDADRAGKNAGGGGGGSQKRGGQNGPVPVLAATAKAADVPIYLYGVGTVQAYYTVTVRAQVTGRLVSVPFREGQDVKKGDLLAQVDPSLYQAAYDQAVAKKAQDEALLANAKLDLVRYTKLAQQNYGSQQQADTQRALVAQDEALVKGDQAAIENAKANLDYTHITSPIDGRTGIRLVDVGNLVQPSDSTGIVVVTQLKPIAVIFTLPEQELPQVMAANVGGKLPTDSLTGDNRKVLDHGTLEVIDNQIDQTTGMVRFKAAMPNVNLQLWPGQFVNARLLVDTRRDAIVIPPGAVQQGPNGSYVYVIDEESKANVRTVTIAQQDDSTAVISSGLKAGEVVVTSGFVRLTNGAKVVVSKPDSGRAGPQPASDATGAPATSAPGQGRRGEAARGQGAAGQGGAGQGTGGQGSGGQGTIGQGRPDAGAAPPAAAPGDGTGTKTPSPP